MKTFKHIEKKSNGIHGAPQTDSKETQNQSILSTIDENFDTIVSILGNDAGVTNGKYSISNNEVEIGVAYVGCMVDRATISQQVIDPLLNCQFDSSLNDILMKVQSKINLPDVKIASDIKQVIDGLLNGNTVLFIQNVNAALIIGSRKVEKRSINKPSNEATVLASLDTFTEDLDTNLNLIIRRLPTADLCFKEFIVGNLSHTKVKLFWIGGRVDKKILEEVEHRILHISLDNINGIGELAELIEDKPLSVFPKYRQTERPDVVARNVVEGKFAILCDNSSFGFIAPISLWDNFKTMDDYSERVLVSTFLRMVRLLSFFIATTSSSIYLAFVTYDQSIVPPSLALNIAMGREGVPFPSVLELLAMTFAIAVIREASLRIPGSVGYFIGSLAAIVLGQAAVSAGYVSASVIIVVAIAAIAAFAVSATTLVFPMRLINYFLILITGVLGMFGLICGMTILICHAVSLESFGMPYLYPLVPFNRKAMMNTFIRAPLEIINRGSKKAKKEKARG